MKPSLTAQINEVEREIAMRRKVYARQAYPNKVWRSKAEADLALEIMEGVLATLFWLRENETDVRAYVQAKRMRTGESHVQA